MFQWAYGVNVGGLPQVGGQINQNKNKNAVDIKIALS
jgi:hypothetical protein